MFLENKRKAQNRGEGRGERHFASYRIAQWSKGLASTSNTSPFLSSRKCRDLQRTFVLTSIGKSL